MHAKKHNNEDGEQQAEESIDEVAKAAERAEDNLVEKCLDLENKYRRALADYQNLLRQTAKEKEETVRYASEHLLLEILPVYDNLKMAMAHVNEEVEKSSWLVGIKHVVKQFKDVLAGLGVEEVVTCGKAFDHNTMEAIDKEMTEDEAQDGLVAKEVKAGYRLKGKLIAPAKVVVYEFEKE